MVVVIDIDNLSENTNVIDFFREIKKYFFLL
jgi:hypothetical protein